MSAGEVADIAQEPRLLKIASPLGPNVLTLRRLQVREAISRPFQIVAEAISQRADIAASELVNQAVTFTVAPSDKEPRHFHGLVRAFGAVGKDERGYTVYRIEAAPRFWTLSLTSDCRVFQDKSAKDIVQQVLNEGEAAPVRIGGTVPSTPRPYCVQWNETDQDFVQRLLDEMGCGYFFQHEASNHTMVVAAANADYPLLPGDPVTVRADNAFTDGLTNWTPVTALQPSKVEALDYDLLRPSSPLKKTSSTVLEGARSGNWEIYGWPGGQHVRPEGDPAKLGMEGHESQADTVTAVGADPRVYAGARIKVAQEIGGTDKTWLVTAAIHNAFDDTHLVSGSGHGYSSALTLIPADRAFRPPNPRPRPVIPGFQSAIVTGPKGEEIHTDEYGRIKVQFLWDRYGEKDEKTSLWVRVMQPFAGQWGGSWFLPRIGDEVIVAFMDGDPDKPIVVGSVYNAEGKPPWSLPDNKTQGGIKTRSSKNGTADNANILRFEDKKGSEELYVQAEKDMNVLVKDARTETINQGDFDGDDVYLIRKGDKKVTVEQGDFITKVGQGDLKTTVSQGDAEMTVAQGDHMLKVDQGDRIAEIGMGDDKLTVSMGDITQKASLGSVTIEAMQSITLKVGASKVVIDQTGVTVDGMMVTLKGTAMLKAESPMTQVTGTGMLKAGGGIIMIG